MGKTNIKPRITLNFHERCIYIGKDVIRALMEPEYITILKNDDKKTLAIIPCEEHDQLSFRVPDSFLGTDSGKFRIYSLQFLTDLKKAYAAIDVNYIKLQGEYDSSMNSVIFKLSDQG